MATLSSWTWLCRQQAHSRPLPKPTATVIRLRGVEFVAQRSLFISAVLHYRQWWFHLVVIYRCVYTFHSGNLMRFAGIAVVQSRKKTVVSHSFFHVWCLRCFSYRYVHACTGCCCCNEQIKYIPHCIVI